MSPTSCMAIPALDDALKLIDDLGVVLVNHLNALEHDNISLFNDVNRGECFLCRKCGLATQVGKPVRHQDNCEIAKLDALVKRTIKILA